MHVELIDDQTDSYDIAIDLSIDDLEQMLLRLEMLKKGESGHFHITRSKGNGKIYDIEITLLQDESLDSKEYIFL